MAGSGAGEVDEGVDGVGVGESNADGVAHVEAFGAVDDFAFDGWVEDADKGAFVVGAGDDAGEVVADLAGEGYSGDPLLHGALNFASGGVAVVEVLGDGGELVVRIGPGIVSEHGLDDALGDEVGEAAVGGGGVCVVERGQAEVAGLVGGTARSEHVLAGTHELDDGQGKVGVVDGIGGALLLEEDVEGSGVGFCG